MRCGCWKLWSPNECGECLFLCMHTKSIRFKACGLFRAWHSEWRMASLWSHAFSMAAWLTGRACCTRATSSGSWMARRWAAILRHCRRCWRTSMEASPSKSCPATETHPQLHRLVNRKQQTGTLQILSNCVLTWASWTCQTVDKHAVGVARIRKA